MAQVTINLPTMENWKTTIFGIITAIAAALVQYLQSGQITWTGGIVCALWAIFCYLVPDATSKASVRAEMEQLVTAIAQKQFSAAIAPAASLAVEAIQEAPKIMAQVGQPAQPAT